MPENTPINPNDPTEQESSNPQPLTTTVDATPHESGDTVSGSADDTATVGTPAQVKASEDSIWSAQQASPQEKPRVKKKYKWGLFEVLAAFALMLVTQLAFSIVIIIMAMVKTINEGNINEAVSVEDEMKKVTDIAYSPLVVIGSSVMMYVCWFVAMWYSTRFRGERSWAKDFWVRAKFPRDIFIGVGVAALVFALSNGLGALLEALGVNMGEASNTEIFASQNGIWKYVLFIGLVSIVGPLMEELFFRGFVLQGFLRHFKKGKTAGENPSSLGYSLQRNAAGLYYGFNAFRHFLAKHASLLSALISATLFGFMHFQGTSLGQMMTVLITGIMGFVFALTALKVKRLMPVIIAHMLYNGTVAVITLSSMS